MKTILWAILTANGNYGQSSPENPPDKEAVNDFVAQAKIAGNFIVGRKTFAGMQASGGDAFGEDAFANVDIVVVSTSVKEIPGVKVVEAPQEALSYLQGKGHQTALLVGGAELHNAFLGRGLVDELIFDVAPILEGKGLNILLDQDQYKYKHVQLLDFKSLGGGVVQLHYSIGPTPEGGSL
jgi:dihydrofolate reductase